MSLEFFPTETLDEEDDGGGNSEPSSTLTGLRTP